MLLKIENISNERVNSFFDNLKKSNKEFSNNDLKLIYGVFDQLFLYKAKQFPGVYLIEKNKTEKIQNTKYKPDISTNICFPDPWEIRCASLKSVCNLHVRNMFVEGVYLTNGSNQSYKFYKIERLYYLEKCQKS